jgi:polar amino acid transport system substrate-binding protein
MAGFGAPPLAMKDPNTGEIRGPALDLARALAKKIGVRLEPVEYPRPGAVLAGVKNNEWDVTFLVADPARLAEADFSPPYMQSDFTYLVLARHFLFAMLAYRLQAEGDGRPRCRNGSLSQTS